MRKSRQEDVESDVLERGLIAHVIRLFGDGSGDNGDAGRRVVGVISSIVQKEHYRNVVLARIWIALQMWSADSEEFCLGAELFEMFRFNGDLEAMSALIEIACSPFPATTQAAVATALEIRERHRYSQEARMEEEARGLLNEQESEREDNTMPDEEELW